MKAVQVNAEDLGTLNKWCIQWGKGPFPDGWLPKTGLWVKDIIAGFIYKTDSSLAFIECIISNPKASKADRREAFLVLEKALCENAKKSGYAYLQGITCNRSVADVGKASDWTLTDYKYAGMVKVL